ncbi:DUF1476 family protein [Sneathiella sp. P13V-1]|uniref:DUF1476 domain-containing protein n=1 Tax=Sneathiella sp. P13V-1 TaxID=2697366 RepID=UPI00187B3BEA|nr:DUF1476 domain-containing protein [Sneathiella sp. P13V-1]MBE7637187.1 DUF1476 family protein [Sneathiella sp. P13V-1]
MSGIDDLGKAHEGKFALDEEQEFKAVARRNKLLGLWAADLMGLTDDAAQEYAKEVIVADLEEKGDDDVFRKIRGDLDAKSVEMSDHRIRREMEELLATAREQIHNGE